MHFFVLAAAAADEREDRSLPHSLLINISVEAITNKRGGELNRGIPVRGRGIIASVVAATVELQAASTPLARVFLLFRRRRRRHLVCLKLSIHRPQLTDLHTYDLHTRKVSEPRLSPPPLLLSTQVGLRASLSARRAADVLIFQLSPCRQSKITSQLT